MSNSKRPGIRLIDTNKYRLRVTTTHPLTGKRKEIDRVISAASIKEAQAAWDQLHEELHTEAQSKLVIPTVGDYALSWTERKRTAGKKFSTLKRIAEHLEKFCDAYGGLAIDKLTPKLVNDWLATMAKHYSGHTCRGALRVVRTMTRDAQADYQLQHWACDRVVEPKPVEEYTEEEPNSMEASELHEFFKVHRSTEPRLFPVVATMAMTGLRFGEATALEWRDIDFEKGIITITRCQYRRVVGTPKTKRGKRTVAMAQELADILREHLRLMTREQRPGLSKGLCFPTTEGTYLDNSCVNKSIHRARKAAGIKCRITAHGLRRTFISLAANLSVNTELVGKIVGHSTVAQTAQYMTAGMDAKHSLVKGVMGLVRGGVPASPADVGTDGGEAAHG